MTEKKESPPLSFKPGDVVEVLADIETESPNGDKRSTAAAGSWYRAVNLVEWEWDLRLVKGSGPGLLRILNSKMLEVVRLVPPMEVHKSTMNEIYAKHAQDPGGDWRVHSCKGDEELHHQGEGMFDELVVGQWLHIEWMEGRTWWMSVGDAHILVTIEEGGQPVVDIKRGFYSEVVGTTDLDFNGEK